MVGFLATLSFGRATGNLRKLLCDIVRVPDIALGALTFCHSVDVSEEIERAVVANSKSASFQRERERKRFAVS